MAKDSFALEDDGYAFQIENSEPFTWHASFTQESRIATTLRKFRKRAPSRCNHVCYLFSTVGAGICTVVCIIVGIVLLVKSLSAEHCDCLFTFQGLKNNWTQSLCVTEDKLDRAIVKNNVTSNHKAGFESFSFQGCESLTAIDLHGNSDLKYLPENFAELTSLRDIHFGWANLRALPDDIGKLVNLETLRIPHTFVPIIPESLTDCTKLEILDVRTTKIKKLPKNLEKWTSLRELHLEHSKMLVLPKSIGDLTNLRALNWQPIGNAWGNHIPQFEFPTSFSKLQKLEILRLTNDYRIRFLPNYITQFTKLTTISVEGCRYFRELPDSIGDMLSLEELVMSNTRFVRFPFSFNDGLVNLKRMKVEHVTWPGDGLPRAICTLCTKHSLDFLAVTSSNIRTLRYCTANEKVKVCAAIANAKPDKPVVPCM